MPEEFEDSFGFQSISSLKELVKSIKPTPATGGPVDLSRVDAVADSAGFVSRESTTSGEVSFRNQRYQRPEPRIPLNMRVPMTLGEAFQRFCEEERYSYPEGLAEIMRRAGLPLR